jgi:hypothetical protein
MSIKDKIEFFNKNIPPEVTVLAATKKRSVSEIEQAIDAGIKVVGENYVQEAEKKISAIGNKVEWHLIGHLQKNKAKKAVRIFDCIQTLDSVKLARRIDKEAAKINKIMPLLVQVNIGCEPQKSGVLPDAAEELALIADKLENISVQGLMVMTPFTDDPQQLTAYFSDAKEIFEKIKSSGNISGWRHLSMGMSSSYLLAIKQGATIVRIGTLLFGPR